jgi:hypothetical protein
MNNDLSIINRIQRTDLRPWTIVYSDDKFRSEINGIAKVEMESVDFYTFQFENAYNPKRKYFKLLIDNTLNLYFNNTLHRLSAALSDDQRKYILHSTLNTDLSPLISETGRVIQETGYKLVNYGTRNIDTSDIPLSDGDNPFVLHYLKFKLIAIYLEIQDGNKIYLKDDPLSLDDLLMLHFNHSLGNTYIQKNKVETLEKENATNTQKSPETEAPKFIPIKGDFRDIAKGVLSYAVVVRNPDRFAAFEEKLFANGYIDLDCKFSNKHGLKNELSIIYHHLISKRYFFDKYFPGNKILSNLLIKKFLNHRYIVNLDKQFNNYNDKSNDVADFIESHYWLSNLPSC